MTSSRRPALLPCLAALVLLGWGFRVRRATAFPLQSPFLSTPVVPPGRTLSASRIRTTTALPPYLNDDPVDDYNDDPVVDYANDSSSDVSQVDKVSGVGLSSSDLSSSPTKLFDASSQQQFLHQQVWQADAKWYQEYVLNILGEGYCQDRWPRSDDDDVIANNGPVPSVANETADADVDDEAVDDLDTASSLQPETDGSCVNETIVTLDGNATIVSMETEESDTLGGMEEAVSNETTEHEPSLSEKTTIPINLEDEPPKIEIRSGGVNSTTDSTDTQANATSSNATLDECVVVYRSIVGNTLTYVPLDNLTHLGYSPDEVTRIAPDAMCVIVTDQVRNPRMGVPLQWLIQKDQGTSSEAPQILDSSQQAQELMEQDELEQQERRQQRSKSRRQTPTERMPDGPRSSNTGQLQGVKLNGDPTGPMAPDSSKDLSLQRETRGPASSARRQYDDGSSRKETFGSTSPDKRRQQKGEASSRSTTRGGPFSQERQKWQQQEQQLEESRRRRRARLSSHRRTGARPRRIYNARDPYSNAARENAVSNYRYEDPPPPKINIPIVSTFFPDTGWVDMDTFRRLLRAEAEFRMRFVGEDAAPMIKKESDWRLNAYRQWLWQIHSGVGGSVVPPSKFERDRRRSPRPRTTAGSEGAGSPRPRRVYPIGADIVNKRRSQEDTVDPRYSSSSRPRQRDPAPSRRGDRSRSRQ